MIYSSAQETLRHDNDNQWLFYSVIITISSEIHTKHLNALCGQDVDFMNVQICVHTVTTELWRIKVSACQTSGYWI